MRRSFPPVCAFGVLISLFVLVSGLSATTFVIEGHTADQEIWSDGTFRFVGQSDMRVGGAAADVDGAAFYIFELPDLGGYSITSTSLEFTLLSISNSPGGNGDLYGFDYRDTAALVFEDYYQGTYGGDSASKGIQNDIVTPSSTEGAIKTSGSGSINLSGFLKDQYSSGAQAGDYVVFRINSDVSNEGNYNYYTLASANHADSKPVLTIITDGPADPTAGPNQLFNLYGASDVPNFPYSSTLVWPDEVGEGDICIWNDDRFAAMSITIDDNTKPDHEWWLQMAEEYDMELTWFVVTGGVGGSNSAFNGTWADWQALADAGHSIQSHTVSHGNLDYLDDYEPSQTALNDNVTGQWAGTLAYPSPGSITPRPDLAKDYFIGARGTVGTPNGATNINYMETNSTSGRINKDYIDSILYGTSGVSWLGGNRYVRGWLCTHFHLVQDRPAVVADLEYIDSLRSEIWVGTFYDVVRFGQERDTAALTVDSVENDRIEFTLADRMDDTIYDFPLTIKFRVPNEWPDVVATQGENSPEAWMVEHEGNQYALVKVVPDRGSVTLMMSSGVEWGGIAANAAGQVNTGTFLKWLYVAHQPWVWSYSLERWLYAPDPGADPTGMWTFFP